MQDRGRSGNKLVWAPFTETIAMPVVGKSICHTFFVLAKDGAQMFRGCRLLSVQSLAVVDRSAKV